MPALERRIASVTFVTAVILTDDSLVQLVIQCQDLSTLSLVSALLPEYRSSGK